MCYLCRFTIGKKTNNYIMSEKLSWGALSVALKAPNLTSNFFFNSTLYLIYGWSSHVLLDPRSKICFWYTQNSQVDVMLFVTSQLVKKNIGETGDIHVSVRCKGTLCLSKQKNILSALKVKGGRDRVRYFAWSVKYSCVLKATPT